MGSNRVVFKCRLNVPSPVVLVDLDHSYWCLSVVILEQYCGYGKVVLITITVSMFVSSILLGVVYEASLGSTGLRPRRQPRL